MSSIINVLFKIWNFFKKLRLCLKEQDKESFAYFQSVMTPLQNYRDFALNIAIVDDEIIFRKLKAELFIAKNSIENKFSNSTLNQQIENFIRTYAPSRMKKKFQKYDEKKVKEDIQIDFMEIQFEIKKLLLLP